MPGTMGKGASQSLSSFGSHWVRSNFQRPDLLGLVVLSCFCCCKFKLLKSRQAWQSCQMDPSSGHTQHFGGTTFTQQRLQRTQIIWVCPDIWVFSVLDKTFDRYLSHLPKVSIWSKKGLESPVPPVEASGNALQTSRLCHSENITFCILFKYFSYSDLERIRFFVAKQDM